MINTKVAFLKSRRLSSQSQQFKKHSKSPDWLKKKPTFQKSHFCFDHVNMLLVVLLHHWCTMVLLCYIFNY